MSNRQFIQNFRAYSKIGNNKELTCKVTCKDRIVYENIEYLHIKEKRDNT